MLKHKQKFQNFGFVKCRKNEKFPFGLEKIQLDIFQLMIHCSKQKEDDLLQRNLK